MALNSSTVNVGDTATASQYNNVRKDVVQYGGDYASTTGSANAYILAVDAQIVTAYVEKTVFKIKANFTNTAGATINVNSLGVKTIKKFTSTGGQVAIDAGDIQSGGVYYLVYDGTDMILINPSKFTTNKFGGTGADGALNIASGTTNLDLASAQVTVKNYTSFNVASGATWGFTNAPTTGAIVIVKTTGDVTIEGTIDGDGDGAAGGTAGVGGATAFANGTAGGDGNQATNCFLDASNHYGGGGGGGTGDGGGASGGAGGTAGAAIAGKLIYVTQHRKIIILVPGSSGGGGGGGEAGNGINFGAGGAGQTGGRGGIALYIECGGALNFAASGVINARGAAGVAGGNGANSGAASGGGGGGGASGGGGGGMVYILYNSLTANAGTINVNGGASASGGTGGTGIGGLGGNGGGGGAGGASYAGASTAGTAGASAGGGANGAAGGASTAGQNGTSLVEANQTF